MNSDSVFEARHALRRLARQPGFSVPVALTLALGIGATAAVYALVNGVLIRPLPYAEASRLVEVGHTASRVDRKSTRLNSSHLVISYAVFCLKKKKTKQSLP